ncbi:MAG: hypothetical protein CO113_12145 [Elusimicrobia bacterium CG_4_9_14_3_um_filter_62_55]|nr:MAG: hypothetical protein CO113_12145 [Elusimicrobia bacterium CG_4_9_14_3_um_filter_62_55]
MRIFPYLAFFGFGSAALITETAFHRALVALIGSTTHAAALSTAIVLAGVALGSYFGGPTAAGRREEALRLFAGATLAAAAFSAMAPLTLFVLSRFYRVVAPALESSWALGLAQGVFAAACLFPPAFFWGAAFPLIAAGAGGRDDGPRRRARSAGWLHTGNTVGAAIGALCAGYLLLPGLGVRMTLMLSSVVGAAAASAALFWDSLGPVLRGEPRRRWRPRETEAELAECDFAETAGLGRFGFAAAFAAGAVVLALEALAVRLVILFFGNTVIVFPLMVAAVLFVTGVSAALGSTWSSKELPPPDRLASVLSASFAVSAVALLALPHALIGAAAWAGPGAFSGRPYWVLLVLLAPNFAMGAALPLALRLTTACGRRASEASGTLYAVFASGAVAGAGIAVFAFAPALGVQSGFCVLAAISALVAGTGWRLSRAKTRAWRWRACAAGAVLASAAAVWRPIGFEGVYARRIAGAAPVSTLYQHDGRLGTSTILEFPGYRGFFLDGIEEASNRFFQVQAAKLLGALPPALQTGPGLKSELIIGFGAGASAGAALHSGLVSTLEVVDANPELSEIASRFEAENGSPQSHPGFRAHRDDGRHFLLRSGRRWQAIVVDATRPLAYDSWSLYTLEFYRLVRERLSPDGVFAQWIPTSELSDAAFRSRVRTFMAVFPHASLWNVPGSGQSMLVATPGPLKIDPAALQARLDRASAELEAERYQIAKAEDFADFFVAGEERLAAYGGKGPLDTDDLPRFQRLALARPRGPGLSFSLMQENLFGDERRFAAARALRRYHAHGDLNALAEAYAIDPSDGNARYHARSVAGTEYEKRFPEKIAWLGKIRSGPRSEAASADQIRLFFEIGDASAAAASLAEARRDWPDSERWAALAAQVTAGRREQHARTREALLARLSVFDASAAALEQEAFSLFLREDFAGAEKALLAALELYPESTSALVNLADLKAHREDKAGALETLKRALAINPFYSPALHRLSRVLASEGEDARARWLEGRMPAGSDRPPYYPCGEYCRPWADSWAAGG